MKNSNYKLQVLCLNHDNVLKMKDQKLQFFFILYFIKTCHRVTS